ncbi:MAG TPA: hypothetical protein VJ733_08620 [Candidatus Binatia bacterium]|nr:hypothetical protein [Candidatus Binatia bacterium]
MAANVKQGRKRNLALRVAFYTGVAIFGSIVLVVLINLYEPDLDPGAAVAMRAMPSQVPDAENSFFTHYGMGVAAGQDPHAYGIRYVTAINSWAQTQDTGQPEDKSDVEAMRTKAETLLWRDDKKQDLCGEPRVDCLLAYARHRPQIEKLTRDNPLLLERYRSLYHYKSFRDATLSRYYPRLPDYAGAEQLTVLAQIALKTVSGNVDEALRDLATDTAYWRRVLSGASTVVSKMVAVNLLSRNYALASEIAAQYRDRPAVAVYLTEMMKPLSAEERSMRGAFISEYQLAAFLYSSLRNPENVYWGTLVIVGQDKYSWLRTFAALFYKPNATINLHYKYIEKYLVLDDAPAHMLMDAARRVDNDFGDITNMVRLDMAYNPIGKIIFAEEAVTPVKYIARIHNLDGSMRLLRLQLAIYSKNVAVKDVGSFLENSQADLFDSYRNQPFRWEPTTRELWFEGINPQSNDALATNLRIGVRI